MAVLARLLRAGGFLEGRALPACCLLQHEQSSVLARRAFLGKDLVHPCSFLPAKDLAQPCSFPPAERDPPSPSPRVQLSCSRHFILGGFSRARGWRVA